MKKSLPRAALLLVASLALLPPLSMAAAPKPDARPNIVIILADDLGYGDVQCYNPQRGKIPTPRIDRLASQGMSFTDAHASSGVCSPSRYTLLTGRYHWRTRLQQGIVGLWGPPLITPGRLTIADLARQHGYRTACIGKWHLGWELGITEDQQPHFRDLRGKEVTGAQRAAWREVFSRPLGGGPLAAGFDHYFGTDVPNWPPFCFIEDNRTVGIPSELLPAALMHPLQGSQQGPALPGWSFEPILPALVERTRAFIADAAGSSAPFLLYLPLTTPHTPLAVNEAWRGSSKLDSPVADLIVETDAAVGQVLNAIEEAGVADNTMVVFTSDNGFASYAGAPHLEERGHFPSGPLRGYKGDAWEGGHRVPFIVRWPGTVPPASVSRQLVHHADLMATLAEVLGAELPDDAGEDSFSLMPVLRNPQHKVRDHAVSQSNKGVFAVRQGPWKLITGPGGGGSWSGKPPADGAPPRQLYQLDADLAETRNLFEAEAGRAAALDRLLEALIRDGRSTPGLPLENDVKVKRPVLPAPRPAAPATPPAAAAAEAPASRPSRPNIVFILADDLGIVDINAYAARFTGAKPEQMFFETPHLDRLVREGTAFSQAYASHLCSPARASILTGKNAARIGFTTAVPGTVETFYSQAVPPPPGYLAQDAIEWPDPNIKIEQALLNGGTLDALPAGQPGDHGRDELTIAEAIDGYRSGFIGKWHLGGHGARGWQPSDQGFEEISYFDEGGSPYFNWRGLWDRRTLAHPGMPQPELLKGRSGGTLGHEYLTDELTAHAVRFIRAKAEAKEAGPFFLYLCHFAVHTPFQAPAEEIKRFGDKPTRGWNGHSNAVYGAMLKRLDDSVGRILETLGETGLAGNTLIVFLSDNGGVTYTDPPATSNAPFKGGKALHYEGGIRVPLIFHWPGRVPAGQWCNVPVEVCDLFPTLIQFAGGDAAAFSDLDGCSLVPLLADPENRNGGYPRDTFYWHYPFNVIVKNPHDGLPSAPHSTIREGDWKLLFDWSGDLKLYNIAQDPFEHHDLSAADPARTRDLFRKLNDWLDANVAVKYMPALNPDYDPARESRARAFVDLRRKHLGEDRAIRHPDADPRFAIIERRKKPVSQSPDRTSN